MEERQYIPVGNEVYIDIEKETNDTMSINGQEMFLDTDFNRLWHARQYGKVKYRPRRFRKEAEDNVDLQIGDKVYVHHFVIENTHQVDLYGEKLYWVQYPMCFCVVRDGEITMLNDYILAKPVLEPEENYITKSGLMIKPEAEYIDRVVKIVKTNHTSHEHGLEKDMVVTILRDADYEMEIEGEKYYVMRNIECELHLVDYDKKKYNIEIN